MLTLQLMSSSLEESRKSLEGEYNIIVQNFKTLEEEYKTLEEEYKTLGEEYKTLEEEYKTLGEEYKTLGEEYRILEKAHKTLEEEFKENSIIESMNEMKERYDAMILNTISLNRYKHLEAKYNQQSHKSIAVSVFLDHILKSLKTMDVMATNTQYCKIQLEIMIAKELLNDSK